MRHIYAILFAVTVLTFSPNIEAQAPFGQPRSGHTEWSTWKFDWEVKDGAGLAIRSVSYNGHLVLAKASLPVIRVKYDGDVCGPYEDHIQWGAMEGVRYRLRDVPQCGPNRVCQRSFSVNNIDWLEISVYSQIGAYRLAQGYFFSSDGQINPFLRSGGLSCNVDHDHHAYWRFDFDIVDSGGDTILGYQGSGSNLAIVAHATESNGAKLPSHLNPRWFVNDRDTARGVWIFPSPNDGTADLFSNKDIGLRLFRRQEDEPWPFGARGHLGYMAARERLTESDIVFWYVAHLRHRASHGTHLARDGSVTSPQMGPILRVQLELEGHTIVNVNSNRCLDVAAGSTQDQANVQQFTCNGGNNQRWRIQTRGGAFQIVNFNSGKCLDVAAGETADQANVQQFACHGGGNQLWRRVGESPFQLVNVNSGKCLDVADQSTANHGNVQQFSCHEGNNQRWKFQ